MTDEAAARSAARFMYRHAGRQPHTEAVANCPHCNGLFLARWALDLLGPEPEEPRPPGPPNPPRVCRHQYWDLGRCIDCLKTANQIDAERRKGPR